MALPRECVRVLTLCAFAMKIFVKESGGERRRVVVGLVVHAFWRWVDEGQTVLVLSRFLQFLVCARQDDGGVMIFLGGVGGG